LKKSNDNNEVDKLFKVDFIKEITQTMYLANVVMVQK